MSAQMPGKALNQVSPMQNDGPNQSNQDGQSNQWIQSITQLFASCCLSVPVKPQSSNTRVTPMTLKTDETQMNAVQSQSLEFDQNPFSSVQVPNSASMGKSSGEIELDFKKKDAANEFVANENSKKKKKITDDYQILETVNSGQNSVIKRCKHKRTGQIRAIKLIRKNMVTQDALDIQVKEVNVLRGLDHPNIIRLYEAYQDDQFYYIISELMEGGELFNYILLNPHMQEKMIASIVSQVIRALSYCHNRGVIHGDIKPENILLGKIEKNKLPIVKLNCFKKSRSFTPGQFFTDTDFYSPWYRCPEIVKGKFDQKCDIWSVGIISYMMVTHKLPYDGVNEKHIDYRLKEHASRHYLFKDHETWGAYSPELKDFFNKMLECRPIKRPNALQCLVHQWFNQLNELDYDTQAEDKKNNKEFMNNMVGLSGGKLQRAVMTFMIETLVSDEEKADLRKVFNIMDKDFTGSIDREELTAGLTKMGVANVAEEVEKIFAIADEDGSGEIEFTEWCVATMNKDILLTQDRLRKAFNHIDADRSGLISLDELQEQFNILPGSKEDLVLQKMIKDVDPSGDGNLEFEEFIDMMTIMVKGEQDNAASSAAAGQQNQSNQSVNGILVNKKN